MGRRGGLTENSYGDGFEVLFWRCGLAIGSCIRRPLAGLGSPVRSRKEKKLLLGAQQTRPGIHTHTLTHTYTLTRTHPHTLTHTHTHTHLCVQTLAQICSSIKQSSMRQGHEVLDWGSGYLVIWTQGSFFFVVFPKLYMTAHHKCSKSWLVEPCSLITNFNHKLKVQGANFLLLLDLVSLAGSLLEP